MSTRNNESALVVGQKSYHPIVEHVVMHSFDIRLPSDVRNESEIRDYIEVIHLKYYKHLKKAAQHCHLGAGFWQNSLYFK